MAMPLVLPGLCSLQRGLIQWSATGFGTRHMVQCGRDDSDWVVAGDGSIWAYSSVSCSSSCSTMPASKSRWDAYWLRLAIDRQRRQVEADVRSIAAQHQVAKTGRTVTGGRRRVIGTPGSTGDLLLRRLRDDERWPICYGQRVSY